MIAERIWSHVRGIPMALRANSALGACGRRAAGWMGARGAPSEEGRGVVPFFRPYPLSRQREYGVGYREGKSDTPIERRF